MMYSFLLIGQSNMAGRGFPNEVEKIPNDGIYVQRNGRWWPMYVPVNPDRVTAGINLAESFAYRFHQDHPEDTVGLITCADGGTRLDQWMPGESIYDHAVMQAKLAMRTSTICGILWHQGESDCAEDRYPFYEEKCTYIMNSLRKELGLEDVPLLLGGLGSWLEFCPRDEKFKNYPHVNRALEAMAAKLPNCAFVSAEGLGCNPDYLHFSAAGLREFGHRYYEKYLELAPELTDGKEADLTVTEIEKL